METSDKSAVTPFLTFAGNAEEAMNHYVSLFSNSAIFSIQHYGPGEPGKEGSVKIAEFTLCGQRLLCIDSPVAHDWTFTPAMSLYVEESDEQAITRYFETLSENGQVLMRLAEYPFSRRFAWVQDKFGVSWQLTAS